MPSTAVTIDGFHPSYVVGAMLVDQALQSLEAFGSIDMY